MKTLEHDSKTEMQIEAKEIRTLRHDIDTLERISSTMEENLVVKREARKKKVINICDQYCEETDVIEFRNFLRGTVEYAKRYGESSLIDAIVNALDNNVFGEVPFGKVYLREDKPHYHFAVKKELGNFLEIKFGLNVFLLLDHESQSKRPHIAICPKK